MNRLRYFILTGIFYGYSKEAIHAFIMRCCDVDMGNESEFTQPLLAHSSSTWGSSRLHESWR